MADTEAVDAPVVPVLLEIDWLGKRYSLDPESVTSREFKAIRVHTGLGPLQFLALFSNEMAVGVLTPELLDVFYWLFLKRGGHELELGEDDYPLFAFLAVLGDSPKAAATTVTKKQAKRTQGGSKDSRTGPPAISGS